MSTELARVPLRLVRLRRRDDGGQAAARAVGAGALRCVSSASTRWPARAPGADGRRVGRARLRPRAPPLRPRRRVRRRAGARAHADQRRDRAAQQPGRAAGAVLVAALWCVVRALEDGRTRWLVLAGVAVGLGFEAKMAAALHGRARHRRRVPVGRAARPRGGAARSCSAGGAALVVVGGAWPALIALTPAGSRPWVSGTSDNSIWSLILGYNGLGRLGGQAGGPRRDGRRRRRRVRRRPGRAAAARREPRRPGRLAARLRASWAASPSLAASRLRRADARTGWVIAVGGAFAVDRRGVQLRRRGSSTRTTSRCWRRSRRRSSARAPRSSRAAACTARVLAPAAVVAGMATELAVLGEAAGSARARSRRSWRRCACSRRPRWRSADDARVRRAALGGRAVPRC